MVTLADLRTENSDVQDTFNAWISGLVSDYESELMLIVLKASS